MTLTLYLAGAVPSCRSHAPEAQAFVPRAVLELLLLEVLWIRAEVSVNVKWDLLFVRGEKLFLIVFDILQKDGGKPGMTNPLLCQSNYSKSNCTFFCTITEAL